MQMIFREAQKSDLPDLIHLLASDELGQQRENPGLPLESSYIDAFDAIQRDKNNQLIVAAVNDQIAGMFQLTFIPYLTHRGSWRCLIEGVRVHHNLRGQGIGEQMFQYAIELAASKECSLVQLTSDKQRPDAIRFYQKLGFIASHEGFKLKL
ncbi:GNAT family N-acetyltransferase [Parendozoicomonas haliclonae]|uniref:Aminoalkylphosphonic acid N-acetyltransferase n=1 Tax=Parendozoicomonas haliclonae TaxID=1960125 RepID=A0A1X7ARJ8_9GAMM|nr:GNAT family N-acetyltransferase [Parendozoicomonas haliclonae]SMA50941.1 aminoalkylphosphonic acid N-acetyltransferase [Parendozoicomonas haliclonae]